MQGTSQVQPYAATLVSLAALGADDARFVIQLPEQGLHNTLEHQRDELHSASRLHVGSDGGDRVVLVDALRALSDAKVQCAVSPGTYRVGLMRAVSVASNVCRMHWDMRFHGEAACGAGLSKFYNCVFTHSADSPEIYCGQFEELTGKTFGCAPPRAIACMSVRCVAHGGQKPTWPQYDRLVERVRGRKSGGMQGGA